MFARVVLESWHAAREFVQLMPRWAFRGQAELSWPLETSFERACRAGQVHPEIRRNLEWWILRQFQRRAHIVVQSPPNPEATLEWLALIQHYGGPTRLLDFTHSFYAAAFFAIEFATYDAAIWAVDLAAIDHSNNMTTPRKQALDQNNREYIHRIEQLLAENAAASLGVMPVEPDRLNERISIQQGVFLFPTRIEQSFIDNLAAAFEIPTEGLHESAARAMSAGAFLGNVREYDSPRLVKILLPRTIHDEAMRDLLSMNMTANTLFPGLDGFARSLHRHLRYWRSASAG